MVVEKASAPPPDRDTLRQQRVRNRILAQEWAGKEIDNLATAFTKLYAQTPQSASEYANALTPILDMLDSISAACDAAAASVAVATIERQNLAEETAAVEEIVVSRTKEVHALRERLSAERKMAERNKQYDAIASLILKWPKVENSMKRKDLLQRRIESVDDQISALSRVKDNISKELRLLLHCADGLQESCRDMVEMIDESVTSSQRNQYDDVEQDDAMDTTL